MNSLHFLDGGAFWKCAWQTTFVLMAGLALSWAWPRRPARSHRILLLTLGLVLLGPPLSLLCARLNYGLFDGGIASATSDPASAGGAAANPPFNLSLPARPETPGHPERASAQNPVRETASPTVEAAVQVADAVDDTELATIRSPGPARLSMPWTTLALSVWILASLALGVRLIAALLLGRRLVGDSTPLTDEKLEDALRRAGAQLELRADPLLRFSHRVRCPMIWCWGRRPVLLLPPTAAALSAKDAASVFCHELAHWQRGDHWGRLLAELVVCLMPWQFLAWAARARLRRLSEQACDDWVLATGHGRVGYAEALTALAPQRERGLAMSAVSSRNALVARVGRILNQHDHQPRLGAGWARGAAIVAVGVLALIALGQPRAAAPAAGSARVPTGEPGDRHALKVRVVDRKTGAPLAYAPVEATGRWDRRTDEEIEALKKLKIRGCVALPGETFKVQTDAQGLATVEVVLPQLSQLVVDVKPEGYAVMTVHWQVNQRREFPPLPEKAVEFRMSPAITISGSVRNEEGEPIADAQVEALYLEHEDGPVMGEPVLRFRPTTRTDSAGAWKMEGISADYSQEKLILAANHEGYSEFRSFVAGIYRVGGPPVGDPFALILKRDARPSADVTGRVLDEQGNPIAKARVQPGWQHDQHFSFGFMEFAEPLAMDSDGRFSLPQARPTPGPMRGPGIPTDELHLTIQADGFEPQLMTLKLKNEPIEQETRLRPGHVLRGRVVDAQGKPIAGAEIDADGWRGKRSLLFQATTEADGAFEWKSAPADEFTLAVRAEGFKWVSDFKVRAGEEPVTITLHPELRISGVVRDAATGQPIRGARIELGEKYKWNTEVRFHGYGNEMSDAKGNYQVTRTFECDGYQLRFTAEDYEPLTSPVFSKADGAVTFDVPMRRGGKVRGTVVSTSGKPVVGAEVTYIGGSGQPASFGFVDGRLNPTSESHIRSSGYQLQVATSDAEGRFEVNRLPGKGVIVVGHADGVIETSPDELALDGRVTLVPWSRVEGVLRVGKSIGAGRVVRISTRIYEQGRISMSHSANTKTDADGRFVFERVRAGDAEIGPQTEIPNGYFLEHRRGVSIAPGATTRVQVGGAGRTVIGQVVAPPELVDQIDWDFPLGITMNRPFPPVPDEVVEEGQEATQTWYKEFRNSPEFKSFWIQPSEYRPRLDSGRRFRFEDVAPGEYHLSIRMHRKDHSDPYGIASCSRMITIGPDAAPDQPPLDLGELKIASKSLLNAGEEAPAFTARSLDASPLSSEDLRGKVTVLHFWADTYEPCRQQIPELRKLHEQWAGDERIRMISLSANPSAKELRAFLKENAMPWRHGNFRMSDFWKVQMAYGFDMIPAIYVIDTQGRIAAANVEFEKVAEAVKGALGK